MTFSLPQKFLIAAIGLSLLLAVVSALLPIIAYGANAPLDENRNLSVLGQDCTVTASTTQIGNQQSLRIMASTTRRAWAVLQAGDNATNTVAFGLNDVNATLATGYLINVPNTLGASSTPNFSFGLKTDFPYTGAITAITDNGSTTIRVIECTYP